MIHKPFRIICTLSLLFLVLAACAAPSATVEERLAGGAAPTSTVEPVAAVAEPTSEPIVEADEASQEEITQDAAPQEETTQEEITQEEILEPETSDWSHTATVDGDLYVLGNPAAPIRLIDYSDFL
jgi:hypothetical protein